MHKKKNTYIIKNFNIYRVLKQIFDISVKRGALYINKLY